MWIIANWKSNLTVRESVELIEAVGPKLTKNENVQLVVCPSFEALTEVRKQVQVNGFPILIGAQDISPFPKGAYTGEVNGESLKEIVDVCLIGHSERRQNFNESDNEIRDKVERANESGITPVVCVQGAETPVPDLVKVVAYEPVFAIGSGNPDTPENANKVAALIKQTNTHQELEVLYGGSVTSENIKAFLEEENISGVLIGGASLNASEFLKILDKCAFF